MTNGYTNSLISCTSSSSYRNHSKKMMISLSDTRSDCLLKTSILKCFGFMLNYMPKYIQPHFGTILTPVWQLMAQTAEIYVKVVVNQTVESPFSPDNDDGEFIYCRYPRTS